MAGTSRKNQTTSTKGKGRRTTGKKQASRGNSFIRAEVLMIGTFAVSVLLFLSNFHLCGVVGEVLRDAMLGVFGSMGYPAPLLLFVGVCFYMSNTGNVRAVIKIVAVAVALMALCGLAQLLFGGPFDPQQKLGGYYHASALRGTGGGVVGGLLVSFLYDTLGKVGAYLVLIVALLICIVCITEKSIVNFVKRGSGKAYQYAKEDLDRRKEVHAEKKAERREEKRRIREEQRVRGVNLSSTKLEDIPVMTEFAVTGSLLRDHHKEAVDEADTAAVDLNTAVEMTKPQMPSNPADIFIGKIKAPEQISDGETDYLEEEGISPHDVPFDEDMDDAIFARRGTRTLEEMDVVDDDSYDAVQAEEGINYDSIFVPEGQKTVVTTSGKVIETETELLKKKLENRVPENKEKAFAGHDNKQDKSLDGKDHKDLTVGEMVKQKEEEIKKEYIFPPLTLLKKGSKSAGSFSEKEYKETAIKLQQTLQNFGVGVTVTNISCGPSVTRYELHPEQGVKVSRIVALTDDIKLNLAAADIRIEAPIPGKSAVGIEVPNKENNMVLLRDLLESDEFQKHSSRIAFAVGKDIAGQTVVTDIGKMPHLLIAGATGSGKSVCINTLIMSVIYKSSPDDVKLIMIDPKVVELSVYNGIPHLLIPVVTDPKKASGALNWAVAEMSDRYKKFAKYNVRDLKGYNEKIKNIEEIEDEDKPKKLPQIIIIVDELADLMMVAPGEVEDAICRLAQLARAAGIHLVIATQRPSVNVITGLIKANIPSRIAFSVSSGVDSRTIIDMNGAEKLLGKGDMLFYPSGYQKPQRVQGAFVSDQEVSKVVDFLTEQGMKSDYNLEIETKINSPAAAEAQDGQDSRDAYFIQAGKFIIEKDKASIGMLQRAFKIGFNRAARIMDQLAEAGIVGEEEGTKPRKVLMTMEQFDEMMEHEV